MTLTKSTGKMRVAALVMSFCLINFPGFAFFDGQTGIVVKQLKDACPAFASGEYKLANSTSGQNNLILTDIFEHESGARCLCSRSKTDKTARCGPTASRR
ncbi:MAG: hypothetical protein ACRCWF_08740 [Beijerinckiaceae bacterium]